jgi:D-3-phosphoglycerate dehydrogenase / 2-oxoglutarate reductase
VANRPRPLVIQTEDLDPEPAGWLAERCELEVCPSTDPRFAALLMRAEGLVVRTYTYVNPAMLSGAPRLRVIGRAGVALENIDVAACRARGVEVVHTPGANTRAVVEYVTALMVDALRPRMYMDAAVPPERWHELRRIYIGRRQLDELTLGIYGFGRIGSAMARVGAALDMKVLYNDIVDIPERRRAGAESVGVERLLKESDILSVHVDFRPGNRHLLNAAAFAQMKPDALFINTSRGFVVDPAALRTYLLSNPLARAMVDVHDPQEPIPEGYPLLGVPGAKVSPHLASGTERAKRNMSWVVRDVWRVLQGEKPEFPAA